MRRTVLRAAGCGTWPRWSRWRSRWRSGWSGSRQGGLATSAQEDADAGPTTRSSASGCRGPDRPRPGGLPRRRHQHPGSGDRPGRPPRRDLHQHPDRDVGTRRRAQHPLHLRPVALRRERGLRRHRHHRRPPGVSEDGQTLVDDPRSETTIRDAADTVVDVVTVPGGLPATGVRMGVGAPGFPEGTPPPAPRHRNERHARSRRRVGTAPRPTRTLVREDI